MLLAVTGLAREARLIARPKLAVAVGGGNSRALRQRIEDGIAAGAQRVISMGVCGALDPSLDVGDCIVATEIVADDERIATHAPWAEELLERIPNAKAGVIAAQDGIIADSAAKIRLHHTTGAAAADMESHIAAKIARERGLPFAAVRVVSDSAGRTLPPAALVAMSASGAIDFQALRNSLYAKPGQILALVRTAWEAQRAFRVLFNCRHILDPLPAASDLGGLSLDAT